MVVAQELDNRQIETLGGPVGLSPKLIEIIPFLGRELTPREIGEILDYPKSTVKGRLHCLYLKFGITRPDQKSKLLDTIRQRGYFQEEKPSRRIEILRLLGHGLTDKKIAENLRISPETVKNHLATIFQSFEAQDRTQAVLKAIDLGILTLEELIAGYDLDRYFLLSFREEDVLADIANPENTPGNKGIARRLGISFKTVKNHIANILGKLNLSNRTQAAVFYLVAKEKGLVTSSVKPQGGSSAFMI